MLLFIKAKNSEHYLFRSAFHMPWPIDVCDRYILYPEATKVDTCAVIGVIFILRVHAIYGLSKKVTAVTSVALIAELSIKIVSSFADLPDLYRTS